MLVYDIKTEYIEKIEIIEEDINLLLNLNLLDYQYCHSFHYL